MDHFRSETGFKVVIPDHLLMRRSHPMIGASPDGIGEDDEGARISIDAKCTTSRMYDPENCRTRDCFGEEHDEIPSDYVMQAQQQMLVVGADRCYFPVLFDGNKMRQYWVDADQRLQDNIVHNVTEFYNQVTNMNPPEPDFTHDTTVSLIKDMFGVDTGLEMTFSDDILPLYERYVDAKQQIGAYTKIKDASQAALLFAMGEATRALVPGTGRQICRTAVDEKYWEQEDVDRAMEMLGEVKRKGYVRVTERKAK